MTEHPCGQLVHIHRDALDSLILVQLLKHHSVFIFIRNDALAGQSVTPSVS